MDKVEADFEKEKAAAKAALKKENDAIVASENARLAAEKAAMKASDEADHLKDLADLKKVQDAEIAKKKLEAIELQKKNSNAVEKLKLEASAKAAKLEFDKAEHKRAMA